jgi:diguanylate cyclase (GGDEF)-like protein
MSRSAAVHIPSQVHDLRVLASLLDTVSDSVVIVDTDATIVAVSPAARHVLGAEPGLRVSAWAALRPILVEGSPDPVPLEAHPLNRALAGERLANASIRIRPKRAVAEVEMQVSARPLSDGANVQLGAVATFIVDDASVEERLASYVQKLEDSATEVGLITEMGDFLQSCLSTQEFYGVVEQYAPRVFRRESGGVYLLDATRHSVEPVADWGDEEPGPFPPEDCWALRRGRAHIVSPDHPAPRCNHVHDEHHEAYLCLPMMAQGEILGIVHLRMTTGVTYDEPDFVPNFRARQATTRQVAEQISMALANLRLRDSLRTQAVRDPMTSLYNRRYMQEFLKHNLQNASDEAPLSVIMIDLDHFKRFNDTFGHAAADLVLVEVARILVEQSPANGIACRYGGEELTLVLPSHDHVQAEAVAERLRATIADLSVNFKGETVGKITASLGVSSSRHFGTDPDVVLQGADKAMYEAKEGGRNRVCVALPEGA